MAQVVFLAKLCAAYTSLKGLPESRKPLKNIRILISKSLCIVTSQQGKPLYCNKKWSVSVSYRKVLLFLLVLEIVGVPIVLYNGNNYFCLKKSWVQCMHCILETLSFKKSQPASLYYQDNTCCVFSFFCQMQYSDSRGYLWWELLSESQDAGHK